MFVSPQDLGVETLPCNVMDQEVQPWRSHRIRRGLQGGLLTNGISVLLETWETFPSLPLSLPLFLSLSPFLIWEHSQEAIICQPGGRLSSEPHHSGTPILNFQPSELGGINFCFFITTSSMALCYSTLNRLRKDKSKDIHEAWPWSGQRGSGQERVFLA